jgi:hypothetical protein
MKMAFIYFLIILSYFWHPNICWPRPESTLNENARSLVFFDRYLKQCQVRTKLTKTNFTLGNKKLTAIWITDYNVQITDEKNLFGEQTYLRGSCIYTTVLIEHKCSWGFQRWTIVSYFFDELIENFMLKWILLSFDDFESP